MREISFEVFRVGLSLLFFILSLLGNATYGGGVRGIQQLICIAMGTDGSADTLPFYGEEVLPHQSTLVDWESRNDGRRHPDFHTVSPLCYK